MDSVQKYNRLDILLSPDISSSSEEILDLYHELDLFNNELSELDKTVASIEESSAILTKEINEATDAIAKLGLLTTSGSKYSGQIGGTIGVAAAIAKTYGNYVGKKRSNEAHKRAEEAKAAIMQRKKDVAAVKLHHIREMQDNLTSGCSVQIENLFKRELAKVVSLEEPARQSKIGLFIKVLSLTVKSRFIIDALGYYIRSMEAWSKGKNVSTKKRPSIEKELSLEISGWDKLLPEGTTWDKYLVALLNKTEGPCPLPVAALLSNPCLLRNYIGINIGIADNCPGALIQLQPRKQAITNPLVTSNPYFIHCKDIIAKDYNPPQKKRGFGIEDLLLLLIIPAAFFGLTILVFKLESSIFWRVFWMLPIMCWTGLGIEYLDNNYYRLFPFASRQMQNDSENEIFRKSIIKAENKADFHILA